MVIPKDIWILHNDLKVINSKNKRESSEFEQENFIASVKFMQQNIDIANCFLRVPNSINYNQIIHYVQNNGIKYISVVIVGESKSLLKLQDNPLVHCVSVNDIALW